MAMGVAKIDDFFYRLQRWELMFADSTQEWCVAFYGMIATHKIMIKVVAGWGQLR